MEMVTSVACFYCYIQLQRSCLLSLNLVQSFKKQAKVLVYDSLKYSQV